MSEKVIDSIRKADKPLFTFELLPPLKGKNISEIYKTVDPLVEFNPAYINITYHQQEVFYKERSDNLLEKYVIRKRPGTVAIAAAIRNKYDIPVVPHLICGGFSQEDTEDALIDLHFLGINNVLALRGDIQKGRRSFKPEPGGHRYASELVEQILNMNTGKYLHEITNATATDFCVGVAGYPEKHIESPNLETDMLNLKHKIDLGAEYIVTQLFFNNQYYFDFVKRCREYDINVPIIPGLKPITKISDLNLVPQTFWVNIPDELVSELKKCKTNDEVRHVGTKWATAQSKELVKYGVPAVHYYTIGRSDNIREIATEVF